MSEIKNGGLDQYGTEPFEHQQFRTAGVEGVKRSTTMLHTLVILFVQHHGEIAEHAPSAGPYDGGLRIEGRLHGDLFILRQN